MNPNEQKVYWMLLNAERQYHTMLHNKPALFSQEEISPQQLKVAWIDMYLQRCGLKFRNLMERDEGQAPALAQESNL